MHSKASSLIIIFAGLFFSIHLNSCSNKLKKDSTTGEISESMIKSEVESDLVTYPEPPGLETSSDFVKNIKFVK